MKAHESESKGDFKMRTVSLITVLTVVFVAVFMMSFAISTATAQRNGWQGGVYGSTSLWDT